MNCASSTLGVGEELCETSLDLSRDPLQQPLGSTFLVSEALASVVSKACSEIADLRPAYPPLHTTYSLSFLVGGAVIAWSNAAAIRTTMARQQLSKAHLFAFAESLSHDGRLPLPDSVWLSRALTMAQTFAIPFAFYFKPVIVFIAMSW